MKCPVDQSELSVTNRHGVEIDYCPQCRGVWLNGGELDKMIERGSSAPSGPSMRRDNHPEPLYQKPPQYGQSDEGAPGHHKE